MPRSDYTPPTFTDVPQAQWGSPPAGAVALDSAHLNALVTAIGNSARQSVLDVRDYGAKGDGTTNDTAALSAAFAACPTGGTLYFPAGTYIVSTASAFAPALNLNRPVTLASGAGAVLKAAATASIGIRLVQVTTSDVTIQGLGFDAGNLDSATCIYASGATRLAVTGCTFTNTASGALDCNDNCIDVLFTHNRVRSSGYGVLVNDGPGNARINISDNLFDGLGANSADAIEINGATQPRYDITVSGNVVSNYVTTDSSTGFGIAYAYVIRGTISGNVVRNCSRNGIHIECKSQNVTVTGNSVYNCGHAGIEIQGEQGITCSNVTVTGNTVVGCCTAPSVNLGRGGIDVGSSVSGSFAGYGAAGIVIANNVIDANRGAGIYLFQATDSVVNGNLITNTYGTSTDVTNAGSVAGHNTAMHIISCTNTNVYMNRMLDTQATPTQFYPIYFYGASQGIIYGFNNWAGNIAGQADLTTGVTGIGNVGTTGGSGSVRLDSGAGKLGFFGAAPIATPTGAAVTAGYTSGTSTTVTIDGKFTGGTGSTAYTVADLVSALKRLGLITS